MLRFFVISILLFLSVCLVASQSSVKYQSNKLDILGTRSWIKVGWKKEINDNGFRLYWSTDNNKPKNPQVTLSKDTEEYYITDVNSETEYFIWFERINDNQNCIQASCITKKKWELRCKDTLNLYPHTSRSLPVGMVLYWHDEFNDKYLDLNKWSTNYYSTIDYRNKTNFDLLKTDRLPQPHYILNGETLKLITCDSLPSKPYFESGRKISSIQTYDWNTNETLLDNSSGGYFEIRAKRNATDDAKLVNTAFWFDSPGPDLKYYIEKGSTLDGVLGIRPKGQPFEIDFFEYLNTEIVLHGSVGSDGEYLGNIGHKIVRGINFRDKWIVYGMLWTPTELQFFIDGSLVAQWSDVKDIKSPNHLMNVFIGSYGFGGTVTTEVDYIRYYKWKFDENNKIPNSGFEYNGSKIYPWTGNGYLSTEASRSGKYGLVLAPNSHVEQYIFLPQGDDYLLKFWSKGSASSELIEIKVEEVEPVVGTTKKVYLSNPEIASLFQQGALPFSTEKRMESHMSIVRVFLKNHSKEIVYMDDLEIVSQ